MDNRPIGVFDSGMGGLSVRAEIVRALPNESVIYFGDGKNVPYGPRPHEEITALVDNAVSQLIENQAKLIVVACNAATGAAIEHLRAKYYVPIIGMEPAVKPAAESTQSGIIGVLATAAALRGELYRATAARFRDHITIIEAVGEGFVELVENGLEGTPEALETVEKIVAPMVRKGVDRIVLGCTHYPFLRPEIAKIIPVNVQIIDSGAAIARRVEQILDEKNLRANPTQIPDYQFLTAADENYRQRLVKKA